MNSKSDFLERVQWNEQGLIPAIAQDNDTGEILMLAWMNQQALELTIAEGIAVYWSRSRQQIWRKGEQSGHTQKLHELRLDCDGDTILMKVDQVGGIACHTGRKHCFYLRYDQQQQQWQATEPVIRDPKDIYSKPDEQ